MDIGQLIDRAKEESGFKTDLELAKALGVSHGAPHIWRIGRSLPKPETANKLALMADEDPAEIVAEVLMMSAKDDALRRTFARMKSAVSACFCLVSALPSVLEAGQKCILC